MAKGEELTFKFAELYRDGDTGLDYAVNRYLSGTIGRFLSVDPEPASRKPLYPKSFNAYVYALNDPVNLRDSTGTLPTLLECKGGLAGPNDEAGPPIGCIEISFFVDLRAGEGVREPKPRLDKDKLTTGAQGLIDKSDRADFLTGTGQKALLSIVGKSTAGELDEAEKAIYDSITAKNIMGSLKGADFIDAHRDERTPLPDGRTIDVKARALYNGGVDQSITFFNSFFAMGSTARFQTVLHEAMHLIFAFGDSDLAQAAGVYTDDLSASEKFQNELKKHCK